VVEFRPTDGSNPHAGLVSDATGDLWGTTVNGGANVLGTVFKFKPSTGALRTIVDFTGAGGANPYAALVRDGAGNFWGTTIYGGALGDGTVFKINASNAQYLQVNLGNVTDVLGNSLSAVSSPQMGVLLGDVDANGRVHGNDVSAVQSDTRQVTSGTNYRFDVDANGRIDGNDVSTTQTQTRTGLPSPP
jgi:uncharacterized repeat protein (TIGR03803 family)